MTQLLETKVKDTGAVEKLHYEEEHDRIIVETIYDADPVLEQNAALRASEPVTIGSKGQQLVLGMSLPLEHVEALKNMGYNLFSPDREEVRRAILYVQANQQMFLTTNKKMFADRPSKWR